MLMHPKLWGVPTLLAEVCACSWGGLHICPRLYFLLALVVSMHSIVSQPAPFSLPVLEHNLSNRQGDMGAHQEWVLSHFPHFLLTLDSLLLVSYFNQTHPQACCLLAFPFAACMATARPGILHSKLREPTWLQSFRVDPPPPLLAALWMSWDGSRANRDTI